jgi:transposase
VSEAYEGRQIVGIDLHRRRSVLVRMTEDGQTLETTRISNDVDYLRQVMARAGEAPEVVLEATYGWYWAADALSELGATVHLAHPLGVKAFEYRRVKNDVRDASDLADLLRMGRLPQAWIAPPEVRELRGLVRHRAKLVAVRAKLKCQVHGVLAGAGVAVPMSDLFGLAGRELLDRTCRQRLGEVDRWRVASLCRVLELVDGEIDRFQALTRARLGRHAGYRAIQVIPGVGPVLAAVFVAEIGDVTRFSDPARLASWAGLTPRHRESDTKVHRGHITKQGSRLVRWAAVEAVQRIGKTHPLGQLRDRVAERRGRNIGKVAAARELTRLVFYGLRDGHIRALAA